MKKQGHVLFRWNAYQYFFCSKTYKIRLQSIDDSSESPFCIIKHANKIFVTFFYSTKGLLSQTLFTQKYLPFFSVSILTTNRLIN